MRPSAALIAAALAMFPNVASAAETKSEPAATGPGVSVHRLGPDARQLRFEGESSARTWAVYVTAAEAQSRARVRLSYSNAISVMPEVSTIRISVNDVEVAKAPIAAASDPGNIDVELPRGLLTAGYNAVRINVAQRHRVDCSLEATYELMTQLDLATSGLTFPGVVEPGIVSLDDLAAISPDASGAVTIRAVLPDDAPPAAIDAALEAVEATVIRARIARPNVEIVKDVDSRPGLYVLAGVRADLTARGFGRYLGSGDGLRLAGPTEPGQILLVATGETAEETEAAIHEILPTGSVDSLPATAPAALALKSVNGYPIDGPTRVSFHDLGLTSEEFDGRLYRASFDLLMPPDFYPADYDKLTLALSVGYAAGLSPGAQILVRVNDLEAGSMPLRNPRGGVFSNRPISVSLSALRPGVNHVVVEAQTPAPQDGACEVSSLLAARKRFALFDRSELIVPELARIAKMPNLAVTMSSGFPYAPNAPGKLFIAKRDNAVIGAAASFLARAAAVAGHPIGARVTFDAADLKSGSALLFGALEDFGPQIFRPFSLDEPTLRRVWARPGAIEAANTAEGATPFPGLQGATSLYDQWADSGGGAPGDFGPRNSLRAIYDRYFNVHRSDFALLRSPPTEINVPDRSTMLVAQARAPGGGSDTWTLIVAANDAELTNDIRGLVAPANWNAVEGRAAAFKPRAGAVNIEGAAESYFIPTRSLGPGNLRLIAAGLLSSNIDYYLMAFLLGALILGALTHWTVKVFGVRS